ncbi:MAG: ribonuclease D [Oceanobacter sp.]
MTEYCQPEPVWVQSDAQLAEYAEHWQQSRFLALDTEFVRTSTFYPKAGLIQLADADTCYLIDPLAITCWQPLAAVLTNPSVLKVFHACAEDLEVCQRLTGVMPTPLADTQMAAAMAGLGGSLGFQKLVGLVLDVELSKGETRSNWLHRPLTEQQVHYAVADVYYLQLLYPLLEARLEESGRLAWLSEDCARVVREASEEPSLSDYYRRVKMAWKLRPQEQYVLQQLVGWREQQARLRDVPRNKVVDDGTLWNIARFKPSRKDQLVKAGMKPEAIRKDAEALLALSSEALQHDRVDWPVALEKPLKPAVGQWLKDGKALVSERAEALGVPPEILARKKPLEQLLRSGLADGNFVLPEPLSGWRCEQIGLALQELFGRLYSAHTCD